MERPPPSSSSPVCSRSHHRSASIFCNHRVSPLSALPPAPPSRICPPPSCSIQITTKGGQATKIHDCSSSSNHRSTPFLLRSFFSSESIPLQKRFRRLLCLTGILLLLLQSHSSSPPSPPFCSATPGTSATAGILQTKLAGISLLQSRPGSKPYPRLEPGSSLVDPAQNQSSPLLNLAHSAPKPEIDLE